MSEGKTNLVVLEESGEQPHLLALLDQVTVLPSREDILAFQVDVKLVDDDFCQLETVLLCKREIEILPLLVYR